MPSYVRCEPDDIPQNSVVVHVWKAMGRVIADVACSQRSGAEEYVLADFPRPVPLALKRAEEVCRTCDIDLVAVVLTDGSIWRSE